MIAHRTFYWGVEPLYFAHLPSLTALKCSSFSTFPDVAIFAFSRGKHVFLRASMIQTVEMHNDRFPAIALPSPRPPQLCSLSHHPLTPGDATDCISAIGIIMSSVCLSVCPSFCNAVHCGAQRVKSCTVVFLADNFLLIQTLLLYDVSFSHKTHRKKRNDYVYAARMRRKQTYLREVSVTSASM